MRKRLGIATIPPPQTSLFLDEPTTGLDQTHANL